MGSIVAGLVLIHGLVGLPQVADVTGTWFPFLATAGDAIRWLLGELPRFLSEGVGRWVAVVIGLGMFVWLNRPVTNVRDGDGSVAPPPAPDEARDAAIRTVVAQSRPPASRTPDVPKLPVPTGELKPTYKGTAQAYATVAAWNRIVKQADAYRDDDPARGRSYRCPHCEHRTYTVDGGPAMISHVATNHSAEEPDLQPVSVAYPGSYPPRFDAIPADRFEGKLETYCERRAKAIAGLEDIRRDLLRVAGDAGTDVQTRFDDRVRPFVEEAQRLQGDWPEADRLGPDRSPEAMRPAWAAEVLADVDAHLKWLRDHGWRCDH